MKDSVLPKKDKSKFSFNIENITGVISQFFNFSLIFIVFFTLLNKEHKYIEKPEPVYLADCVLKATAEGIKMFGMGKGENRNKTIEYVNEQCGVNPYHLPPTQEEIDEILKEAHHEVF